jgi:hypothetical protein
VFRGSHLAAFPLLQNTLIQSKISSDSFTFCSRASTKMRVLTDQRDEGSQLGCNLSRICSYAKSARKSFIICSSIGLSNRKPSFPAVNLFSFCSRASDEDASPEGAKRPNGSHQQRKSSIICSYAKRVRNSFRICSSKTKDLKSFRIRSYGKTLYLSPMTPNAIREGLTLGTILAEHSRSSAKGQPSSLVTAFRLLISSLLVRRYFLSAVPFCISCPIVPWPLRSYNGTSFEEVFP